MQQQNNSNKTTFKVKFLGKYHDMVIDWNDAKYEYKQQQVFEQLASVTGIPAKYKVSFWLLEARPVDPLPLMEDQITLRRLSIDNIIHSPPDSNPINSTFVKDNIHDVCIENGERFHLSFYPFYDFFSMKRIGIIYELVPENRVQEGVCSYSFCQYKNTKTYFNKVKDLVCNDDLNSQISQRVQSIMEWGNITVNSWWRETDTIFSRYNVQQFLRNECDLVHRESIEEGYSPQRDLYARMRG